MSNLGKTTTTERPRQFAREIIKLKTGKDRFKKTETEIALSLNYSPKTARNPIQIKRTKAYQDEKFNILDAYENERKRLIEYIQSKALRGTKYNQAVEALKTLTHDIQLIGGNATERIGGKASEELAALIGDIRQVAAENKMKQAAIVQIDPVEPQNNQQDGDKPLEIEPSEAEASEVIQSPHEQ